MKRGILRLVSMLLTVVLVSSMLPLFASAAKEKYLGTYTGVYGNQSVTIRVTDVGSGKYRFDISTEMTGKYVYYSGSLNGKSSSKKVSGVTTNKNYNKKRPKYFNQKYYWVSIELIKGSWGKKGSLAYCKLKTSLVGKTVSAMDANAVTWYYL